MHIHLPYVWIHTFVLLMNFFTSCWSVIPAHVHLFVHPYWESFYPSMLRLRVVQRGLQAGQITSHPCWNWTASAQHLGVSQSGGLLSKRWPVMAALQYTVPQDHWGKDYLTASFPSLRKKAHTHLWLISLLKLSWELRLLFQRIWGSYQNFLHVIHRDSVLCRGGIYCCMQKSRGKGRQCSDLLQSSPAKPPVICIHFSCANMV